ISGLNSPLTTNNLRPFCQELTASTGEREAQKSLQNSGLSNNLHCFVAYLFLFRQPPVKNKSPLLLTKIASNPKPTVAQAFSHGNRPRKFAYFILTFAPALPDLACGTAPPPCMSRPVGPLESADMSAHSTP